MGRGCVQMGPAAGAETPTAVKQEGGGAAVSAGAARQGAAGSAMNRTKRRTLSSNTARDSKPSLRCHV